MQFYGLPTEVLKNLKYIKKPKRQSLLAQLLKNRAAKRKKMVFVNK